MLHRVKSETASDCHYWSLGLAPKVPSLLAGFLRKCTQRTQTRAVLPPSRVASCGVKSKKVGSMPDSVVKGVVMFA